MANRFTFPIRGGNLAHSKGQMLAQDIETRDRDLEDYLSGEHGAMRWRSNWNSSLRYPPGSVVLDDGWTMVCVEPSGCTERPAPQAIGPELWVYDGAIGSGSLLARQLIVGNKYTWINGSYLNGYRVNVIAGNNYALYSQVEGGALVQQFAVEAVTTGWIEFPITSKLVQAGTVFAVFMTIAEPDPTPTTWNGDWYYDTPPNQSSPGSGVVMHANSTPDQMWFNKIDNLTGDRTADFATLEVGDVINANGASWSIQNITDQGATILFTIAPTVQTAPDAVYNFVFETVTPTAITYAVDTDWWPTSTFPQTKGLFSDDGIDSVVENDNAYGVDLLIQEATASGQWEAVSWPNP